MKYISYLLAILGIYFFVFACQPPPCTDDGCPEFNELTSPPENLDVGMIEHDYEIIPTSVFSGGDVSSLNSGQPSSVHGGGWQAYTKRYMPEIASR